jgi:preprotein translocase subunit Sss1
MPHFIPLDLVSLAIAMLIGGCVICLPGYAVGWWLDLLQFKSENSTRRWCLSLLFGISVVPIILYLPFRLGSSSWMYVVLAILVIAAIFALKGTRSFPKWNEVSRSAKITTLVFLFIGVLLMLDIAVGTKLYPSWVIIDQSYRTQVSVSLTRSAHLPPASPFFHPGHTTTLRYHYLLFVFSSLMERLSNGWVPARIAICAVTLWCGLALLALVSVYCWGFLQISNVPRATRLGWILLGVGGLDVIPVLGSILIQKFTSSSPISVLPDVEWWNQPAVLSGWIDTVAWAPHHLASLIACFVGCLVLWHVRRDGWHDQSRSIVAAAACFASATGLSVLIPAVFAVFLLLVLIELLLNSPKQAVALGGSGLLALVLSAPLIQELRGNSWQSSATVFSIALRQFQPINEAFSSLGITSPLEWNLAYLLSLPLNFFLELGLFFVIGVWWAKERLRLESRQEERLRGHLTAGLAAVSLILSSIVWMGTNFTNDFGMRGVLPAQFVLLLAGIEFYGTEGAETTARPSRRLAQFVLVLAALGIATNVVDLVLLRTQFWFAESGKSRFSESHRFDNAGERFADLRTGYSWIRAHTARDAVVQEYPDISQTFAEGQYSERGTAVYGSFSSYMNGSDIQEYRKAYGDVLAVFSRKQPAAEMAEVCKRLGINYLAVQDIDPAWSDNASYVWTKTPAFAARRVRIFECH